MNWEAIGAIGDAVGGFGVLATLLYLAVQTRQNTRAVRAATYSQVADSFADVSLALFQDPDASRLIRRAREEPGSLTPEEVERYELFLLSYMRRAENMYFQSEEGTLDADTWLGIRESIFIVLGTEPSDRWWRDRGRMYNTDFRRFVDEGRTAPAAAHEKPEDSA
jgi:hypothetical protein